MADTKLSDLTAETSPTLTDLLYLVANPATSPVSRQVTLANVNAALKLDDLVDVAKASVEDNQPLVWDTGTSKWVNGTDIVVNGTVYGGNDDGDELTFQSNTQDFQEFVVFKSPARFDFDGQTFNESTGFGVSNGNSALSVLGGVGDDQSFTLDNSINAGDFLVGAATSAVIFNPTVTLGQNANPAGLALLFQHAAVYQNDPGNATSFGALYVLANQCKMKPDTDACTATGIYTVYDTSGSSTAANGGTLALPVHHTTLSAPTLGSGTTLASRIAHLVSDPSGAGAASTGDNIGLAVEDLTGTAFTAGVMTGFTTTAALPASGDFAYYSASTRPSFLNGPLQLGQLASTPADTGNSDWQIYAIGSRLVFAYEDAGTTRYYYFDGTDAAAITQLDYSTTAPT